MPFAIKSVLDEERCLGGGQLTGLAAALQNTTDSHLEPLCMELV
jgi:hypothetical protein